MKIIVFFKINSNCNGNHQSQLYPTIILSMKQMSIKCMKIHKMIQNKTNYNWHLFMSIFLLFWCFGEVVSNGTNGKNKSNKIFDCVCMYIFHNMYLCSLRKKCNTYDKVFNSFASETKVIIYNKVKRWGIALVGNVQLNVCF